MIEAHPDLLRVAAEFRELVIDLLRDGDREGAHDAVDWAFEETAPYRPQVTTNDSVAKVTSPEIVRILIAGGVHTIGDLCEFTFDGLVEAFQFRRKTVSLIAAALDLLGFGFKRE